MRVHAVIINNGVRKEFTYDSVKMMKEDKSILRKCD